MATLVLSATASSFLRKLLGPIVGYCQDFELLQFVHDLALWSGKNACAGLAKRLLEDQAPGAGRHAAAMRVPGFKTMARCSCGRPSAQPHSAHLPSILVHSLLSVRSPYCSRLRPPERAGLQQPGGRFSMIHIRGQSAQ